jgi:tRNA nucleotidyltransferase (CCA-adding enzyme)
MDDPLRVLRCVRFASRFEYELAPDVREAIQEQAIRARCFCCFLIEPRK